MAGGLAFGTAPLFRCRHRARGRSTSPAWPVATVIVLVCVASSPCGDAEWEPLVPDTGGPFDGWVTVVDDPQPLMSATERVVEIDGQRFEAARPWPCRSAADARRGDHRRAHGDRVALSASPPAGRAQHVVGELT